MSLSRKKVWKIFAVLMFLAAISLLFTGCSLFTRTYNINYVLKGGINSSSNPSTFTKNDEILFQAAKKVGYDFDGWYFDRVFSQKAEKLKKGTKGDVTVYAKWTPKTYVLTYDTNGGTIEGGENSKNVVFDSAYGDLPTPTKAGCTFEGWFTQQTGGDKVDDSTIVQTPSDHTLYAHWSLLKYTIKYDGNGATSGSTASSDHIFGIAKKLTKNGFIKTGYSFVGWAKSSSSTKIDYEDQQSVENLASVGGSIKLFAVWKTNQYTVVFNPNGGEVSPDSKTVTYGASYGDLPTPTRSGYCFLGWCTDSKCEDLIAGDSLVKIASDHTIYAKWGKNIKITLNSLGATNPGTEELWIKYTDKTIYFDEDCQKPFDKIECPSRDGFFFDKYEGQGNQYHFVIDENGVFDDNSLTNLKFVTSNLTLISIWSGKNYSLSIDPNDGSAKQTMSYKSAMGQGASVEFELTKRIRYNLVGFEIVSCDGGNTYKNVEAKLDTQTESGLKLKVQIKISAGTYGTLAIKAIWVSEQYTITYYPNFVGDYEPITKTYNYGEKDENGVYWTALNADTFVRPGYTFKEWGDENGKSIHIPAGYEWKNDKTLFQVLYAVWTPNTYTVNFEPNGGTIDPTSISATFDEKIKGDLEALPEPKYTGYAFGGWYLDSKYKNKVESSTIFNEDILQFANNDELTLYARKYKTYLLYGYDLNGQNIFVETLNEGISYDIPEAPAINGYTFGGWFDSNKFTTEIITIQKGNTKNLSIYANYLKNSEFARSNYNGGVSVSYKGSAEIINISSSVLTQKWGRILKIDKFVDASLINLYLPDIVEMIGEDAFAGCPNLRRVGEEQSSILGGTFNLPKNLLRIEARAFKGLTKLTNIKFPSAMLSIGANAFEGCTGLTKVVLPYGISSIEASTFAGCTSLKTVWIPKSVTTIGDKSFDGCSALSTIEFEGTEREWSYIEIPGDNSILLESGISFQFSVSRAKA